MRRFLSTMSRYASKRFAPLKTANADQNSDLPVLRGAIFDVDGTLCLPQNYMFTEMRSVLGIPKTTDILTHISSLPPSSQGAAMDKIKAIERTAMASQQPQPGLQTLMTYLQSRGIRKAICTRNFDTPVTHLLTKFLSGVTFDPIVTREFSPPKPDPAGLLFIARSWGLVQDVSSENSEKTEELLDAATQGTQAEQEGAKGSKEGGGKEEVGDASSLIMVGDSIDDMTAGRRAGAATVLLVNKENAHLAEHPHTDFVVKSLDDLVEVLEDGFIGREIDEKSQP
ncbi:HAD-like protein [Xylariaceae sp. FL1272]|nr:HAD-like protein [Xylariaceae sp. FL1272]